MVLVYKCPDGQRNFSSTARFHHMHRPFLFAHLFAIVDLMIIVPVPNIVTYLILCSS